MGSVTVAIDVAGPAADAQALWLDPARWPNIIEDFRAVAKRDDTWPESGRIVWDSTQHGRGRVVERMVDYQPGAEHTTEVEDPRIRGTQHVTFTEQGDGVRVRATLDYELKDSRPVMKLTDFFFVRRSLRDAMRRNIKRFEAERAGDVSL
jgi:hypothetical protein